MGRPQDTLHGSASLRDEAPLKERVAIGPHEYWAKPATNSRRLARLQSRSAYEDTKYAADPFLFAKDLCCEALIHYAQTLGVPIERRVRDSDVPVGRYSKPQGFPVSVTPSLLAEFDPTFAAHAEDSEAMFIPSAGTFCAERFSMFIDGFGTPGMLSYEGAKAEGGRRPEVTDEPKVRTCLWFNDQALPAAEYYCSLLPDSRIDCVEHYPEGHDIRAAGEVLLVEFVLAGTPYQALNGGPHFTLDEAVSISVTTEDQTETDRLWSALVADGGAESQCGWLRDRFGLSWQIVPRRSVELLRGPQAARVWAALMQMKKIDIAILEAAAEEA